MGFTGEPPESGRSPGVHFAYRPLLYLSNHLHTKWPITCAVTDTKIWISTSIRIHLLPFNRRKMECKDGTLIIPTFGNLFKETIQQHKKLNQKISPDPLHSPGFCAIVYAGNMDDCILWDSQANPRRAATLRGFLCLPSICVSVNPFAYKVSNDMCGNRYEDLDDYLQGIHPLPFNRREMEYMDGTCILP